MAKFVALFLCLALVQAGFALECYKCTSYNGYDKPCETAENVDKIPKAQCNIEKNPALEAVCIKYEFKVTNSEQKNVTRGCLLYPKNGKPQECKAQAGFEKVMCDTCDSDLCNHGSTMKISFYSVITLIMSWFAAKIYLY